MGDRVAATYGQPGQKLPTRGPDEEDSMGAVPTNVIDMGAMAAETQKRLGPLMQGLVGAYPGGPEGEFQRSASQTAQGLAGTGLPLAEQLKQFDALRGGPDSILAAQIEADAQAGRFRETRDELTQKDKSVMHERGRDSAETLGTKNKIPEAVTGLDLADQIDDMLDDPLGGNDTMIGGALIQMQAVKGDPSDRELKSAFGADKLSVMDELLSLIQEKSRTGFSDLQKEAIKSYVARTRTRLRDKVYGFLDDSAELGPSYNDYEKQGYRDRVKQLVPYHWRAEWEEDRKQKKGDEPKATDAESPTGQNDADGFGAELDRQARAAGLDPQKIRTVMGPESGGRAGAVSSQGASGVLQIMPDNLRAMGIDPEEYRKLSRTEQLPAAMKFLRSTGLDANSSADDYALAVAASDPKWRAASDDTVIYPKGSEAWKANRPWRPADDGDITKGSILRFYGLRGNKAGEKKTDTGLPEPKTPEEKRIRELMQKAKG